MITGNIDIPGPKELGEEIKKEEEKKTEDAKNFAVKLLKSAEISKFLLQNKYILYSQKGKAKTELKTTFAALTEAGLNNLADISNPIKESLKGYDVSIEENARDCVLILTISIPASFFNQDTENK